MKRVTYHFVFDKQGNLIVRKYIPDLGKAPVQLKEHELSRQESKDLQAMFLSITKRGAEW